MAYLKDFSKNYYGDAEAQCRIMLDRADGEEFVFGTAFLENYIVTYRNDEQAVRVNGYIERIVEEHHRVPIWAISLLALIVGGAAITTVALYIV